MRARSYFISAGEFSGDILGAELVNAMGGIDSDLKPFGIVGPSMKRANVREVANISELSVMGFGGVVRQLPHLRMLEQRILAAVDRLKPEFAVLVDYPGFHFRIAELLHMRGIKVYQYAAPKVWAWGGGRVSKLRDYFTAVLGILPFEEDFFKKHNVNYHYVGTPLLDRTSKIKIQKTDLGFKGDQLVFGCLPGSRMSEIERILPKLRDIKNILLKKFPDAAFVVPVAENMNFEEFTERFKSYSDMRFVPGMSLEIMKICDAAIVASGTATLECAILGTPMAVVYEMDDFSYMIAEKLVKVEYVSLVNLIAKKEVVPEFIQNVSVNKVAKEIIFLVEDQLKRKRMLLEFDEIRKQLKPRAAEVAAKLILNGLINKI